MFEPERRDLAYVPRWSILRVLHRQSVAEHSFFVASYGLKIADHVGFDGDWRDLASYLLRHDEGEALESDIPGPVKRITGMDCARLAPELERRFGPPPQPTAAMVAIRRVADLLDECLYLAGEVALGNRTVRAALDGVSWPRLRQATMYLSTIAGPKLAGLLCSELDEMFKEAIKVELKYDKSMEGLMEGRDCAEDR